MLCKPRGQSRSKGERGQVLTQVAFRTTFVLASSFLQTLTFCFIHSPPPSFLPPFVCPPVFPYLVLFPLPQGSFKDEGGSSSGMASPGASPPLHALESMQRCRAHQSLEL